MTWKQLENESDLESLVANSHHAPQIIFKHSTRCSISAVALSRLQSCNATADAYVLNVIANRALSNQIAEQFGVIHQSPQLLIIDNGSCFFDASHFDISSDMVEIQLALLQNISR